MGRSSGVPINRSTNEIMDGAVSTDDLDVGVGVFGKDLHSPLVSRMAIYQHRKAKLEFRHVINFDRKSGAPMKRIPPGGGAPRRLLEADMAMANWMRALLFDDRIVSGGYRWKKAPQVPLSELDPEQLREADGERQFARPRWFFSQERREEAVFAMFQDNLELEKPIDRLEIPLTQKLIIPPGGGVKAADSIEIPRRILRRLCVQRFLNKLYSRGGDYSGLKDAVLRAMSSIDRLVVDSTRSVANVSAKRYTDTLRFGAEKHLEKSGAPPEAVEEGLESIGCAISMIQSYAALGDSPAFAWVVPEDKALPEGTAFVRVVRPSLSVQILDGVSVESHFPQDGEELLRCH